MEVVGSEDFPFRLGDLFRFHLKFQGCTTDLLKQKWLLKKVVCQTKFLFWWWRVVCFMVHLMEKGKTCGGNSHQNTCPNWKGIYPPKTNMTTENPPFEDIYWYWTWGCSNSHVSLQECKLHKLCTSCFQHRLIWACPKIRGPNNLSE